MQNAVMEDIFWNYWSLPLFELGICTALLSVFLHIHYKTILYDLKLRDIMVLLKLLLMESCALAVLVKLLCLWIWNSDRFT